MGESGQRIVQRQRRELGREDPFFSDVALGNDEIHGLSFGVAGWRPQYVGYVHSSVFAQMTLEVAHFVGFARSHPLEGLSGDADVIGIGKGLGVVANQLLFGKLDRCANSFVVDVDQIIQIGADHRGHVFFEHETKSLFGFESRQFGHFSFAIARIEATDQGVPSKVKPVSAKTTGSSLPSRQRTERSRSLQI
jgi:hypothetical protein